MSEDVGCNRAEKSDARDLGETSHEDGRGAVMALEVSVGQFAECRTGASFPVDAIYDGIKLDPV